ncbi:MAG: diaminopimelate decarboxylase [Micromonosporaceae bacterium]|nr:diaminopimelate decarboxylase [Micromonosporaceae bacterium]
MDRFEYRSNALWCEEVPLAAIAAGFGTPTYVYSTDTLIDHYQRFVKAFDAIRPLICFSAKVLSNVHLLRLLGRQGAGIDAVSGGEMYRAILAGVAPERIVLAGVGKSPEELREAVRLGIRCVNVESEAEMDLLSRIAAEEGRQPRVAIRVNPDVAPDHRTPTQTTTGTRGGKFGVDLECAAELFRRTAGDRSLRVEGFHIHLGSPIFDPATYAVALDRLLELVKEVETSHRAVATIDIGGGFPAEYTDRSAPGWDDYAGAIVPRLEPFTRRGGQVIIEPGRTIAANAGVLLTTIRYLKRSGDRNLAVLDAGMTHLMRAALYDSYHFMWPVTPAGQIMPASRDQPWTDGLIEYDVVGPICESTDYLARGRAMPPLGAGDQIAIFTTGAYGMTMTSNYNSQLRPAEVLVEGDQVRLIRCRETYEDLVAFELLDSDIP